VRDIEILWVNSLVFILKKKYYLSYGKENPHHGIKAFPQKKATLKEKKNTQEQYKIVLKLSIITRLR